MYEQYNHHGKEVWVKSDLKGKHREHCLCWTCNHFEPDIRVKNCKIAEVLFGVCIEYNIVTPVWECPGYEHTSRKI